MERRLSMDFRGNDNLPINKTAQQNNYLGTTTSNSNTDRTNNNKAKRDSSGLLKWGTLALGGIIVVLIVAVIITIAFTSQKSQAGYVNTNKLQAVFLNSGQVYFGNIQEINPQFLVLTNIFYLQTNSSSSSNSSSTSSSNVSLVKLGCQIHGPYDQMMINMQQVSFWENLKSSGQVSQAVAKYYKTYPNGQNCNTTNPVSAGTTSNNSSSSSSAPSATSTNNKP